MHAQKRQFNLSRLSASQKQHVWAWLKTNKPGVAASLQDPNVRALVTTFDGEILIDYDDVKEALGGVDTRAKRTNRLTRPSGQTEPRAARRKG